jgi:hypothetical protein
MNDGAIVDGVENGVGPEARGVPGAEDEERACCWRARLGEAFSNCWDLPPLGEWVAERADRRWLSFTVRNETSRPEKVDGATRAVATATAAAAAAIQVMVAGLQSLGRGVPATHADGGMLSLRW